MKELLSRLLCLLIFLPLEGIGQNLFPGVEDHPAVRHALVGISVKRVIDGHEVYSRDADLSLRPASVTKLIPTVLALKERGKDFVFVTRVSMRGKLEQGILHGDIIVHAGGDPALDSRYFPSVRFLRDVVEKIRVAGIREIKGRIRVEHEGGEALIPGSWLWEDVANYYGAVYHPFNYRDNLYTLSFRSGKIGTPATLLKVDPVQPGVRFENHVLAAAGDADNVWIYGGPDARVLQVRGSMPAHREIFTVKGATHHPDRVFVAELQQCLNSCGILVKDSLVANSGKEVLLLEHVSPTLSEIVFFTNKRSINLFAEALGKITFPDDWETKVKQSLTEMGIGTEGILLKDACGLSLFNLLPASTFTDLLLWAYSNLGSSFVRSLPLAGKDGGLAVYARAEELLDNLQAKTGSMTGVRALAGYLKAADGETYAFTVIVNNYTCKSFEIQKSIREFLVWGYHNWPQK